MSVSVCVYMGDVCMHKCVCNMGEFVCVCTQGSNMHPCVCTWVSVCTAHTQGASISAYMCVRVHDKISWVSFSVPAKQFPVSTIFYPSEPF